MMVPPFGVTAGTDDQDTEGLTLKVRSRHMPSKYHC